MGNRRKPKNPAAALGGIHEPTAWMREATARAIDRLRAIPLPESGEPVTIWDYLTENPDTECDRCGGDPWAYGPPFAGVSTFATTDGSARALMPYGLCGRCAAKERA